MFWFKKDLIDKDTIYFLGYNQKKTRRQIVGRNNPRNRYWHFGVRAIPMLAPIEGFIVKPHVVFSDDGERIWESKARLQGARRSECKNWWNDAGRDQ